MDDFISLPVEVPLIKNSEECAGKPNTGTKLKKKDAPMQQTVPVLHEAEQKGPILEAFAPFNLPLSLPPKREGAAGEWPREAHHAPLENMRKKGIPLLSLKR